MNASHRIRLLAVGGLLALAAPLDAQKKDSPLPPPLPMEPVAFPAFDRRTLSNGAELLVVEHSEQPMVSVNVRIRSGTAAVPDGKAGLAEFVADLLDSGTTTRSAEEIAEAVDFIGATLGGGPGPDWTSITLTTVTDHLDQGLDLLADILLNPSFPEDELELMRRRTLTALQTQLAQPQVLAERQFARAVFGEHPYSQDPTPESVRALTRQDLVDFHRAHFRPDNALVVVAGDVSAEDIAGRLEARLGGWQRGAPPPAAYPDPATLTGRTLHFVHKPGTVQAVIRLGHTLPSATEADWATLDVMNQVLGGGSSSWLFRVLRAEKGYTYGAYSGAVERRDLGFFQATAEVRNEVVDSAMTELLALIERMRSVPVPQEDLQNARAFLAGSFPLRIETPQQVAGQLASTLLLGRSAEWLDEYRSRVASVTAEEVLEAARTLIHPDRAALVVVGDATQILDRLEPFADEVRVLDENGEPLTLGQLTPQPSDRTYRVADLEEGTLVYEVRFQGNPVGESTVTIDRVEEEGRGLVRVEQALALAMGSQTQEVLFEPESLAPVRASTGGSMGVSMTATFQGDSVRGTLTMPNGEGRDLAAELPEGTLVSPMTDALLAVSDVSGTFELPVFVPGQGVVSVSFEVVGETTVEVPAGAMEVLEVRVGGPQPSTLYLRKAYPHIVVRQELANPPLAFELKEIRPEG